MSKTYDPLLERMFTYIGKNFLKTMLQIEVQHVEVIFLETSAVKDHSADFLAYITTTDNKEFIVHLAFQAMNHPQTHLRMLKYLIHIKRKLDETIPFIQVLIYFGRTRLTIKQQVTNATPHTKLTYKYTILDLSQEEPQKYLAESAPESFIFAVLTNTGDKTTEVMHEVLTRLKTQVPENQQPEVLLTLDFLTRLREDLRQIFRIEAEKMGFKLDVKKLDAFELGREDIWTRY